MLPKKPDAILLADIIPPNRPLGRYSPDFPSFQLHIIGEGIAVYNHILKIFQRMASHYAK
jgi:hypothetical protein